MTEPKFRTLIVEDHEASLTSLCLLLDDHCEITVARTYDDASELLQLHAFEVLIIDYDLISERNGVDLLRFAIKRHPHIAPCLISGISENPIVVDLIAGLGGIFIEKPIGGAEIDRVLDLARKNRSVRSETKSAGVARVLKGFETREIPLDFIAESKNMRDLLKGILKAAPDPSLFVHLTGPTGTGKSVLANIIHANSSATGKFVAVNCATLGDLSMSRLFGHAKGSFTGAMKDHFGYIHMANGGTLFLDDVHLLPKEVQGKLLQVLDNGKYQRLGETIDRESKFRLISAASINVLDLARRGDFVIDLWFRMAGKMFSVPSLSERRECIPRLVHRMIAASNADQMSGSLIEIEPDALELLSSFSWDGNVRDLANSVRALCVDAAESRVITVQMVRMDLGKRAGKLYSTGSSRKNSHQGVFLRSTGGLALAEAVAKIESTAISEAMKLTNKNQMIAAKILGIGRGALIRKLAKYKDEQLKTGFLNCSGKIFLHKP